MPYFLLRSTRDKDLRIKKCSVLRHELSPQSERDIIINLGGKLYGIECAIPLTPVQAMNQLELLGYNCVGMSHAEPGLFYWTIRTPQVDDPPLPQKIAPNVSKDKRGRSVSSTLSVAAAAVSSNKSNVISEKEEENSEVDDEETESRMRILSAASSRTTQKSRSNSKSKANEQ